MSVYIKNVELGAGKTRICLPIIAKTRVDILKEGMELKESVADIIEWRVDFFEDVMDVDKTLEVMGELADILEDKPVLFTFRTKNEGGEKQISANDYKSLVKSIIRQQKAGAVDVEMYMESGVIEEIVDEAKNYDIIVVASNHDFSGTPDKNTIVNRLISMKEKGAHISKIAVMPQNESDVLKLMQATYEAREKCPDITIITMSMGKLGMISRMGGGVFGSAMTFGAKTKEHASAPGQIEAAKLKEILEIIGN